MTFDQRLLRLIRQLGDRVIHSAAVVELVEHNERGVALEMLVQNLYEDSAPITEEERADCIELTEELPLGTDLSALVGALPIVPRPR